MAYHTVDTNRKIFLCSKTLGGPLVAYSATSNRLYSSMYDRSNEGHCEGFESFRCHDL